MGAAADVADESVAGDGVAAVAAVAPDNPVRWR